MKYLLITIVVLSMIPVKTINAQGCSDVQVFVQLEFWNHSVQIRLDLKSKP